MNSLGNVTDEPLPNESIGSRNSSYIIPGVYDLTTEDTNWVLTSSFIIFTMQTGEIPLKIHYFIVIKIDLSFWAFFFLFQDSECWSLVVCRLKMK